MVPNIRIHTCNDSPVRPEGQFVLYWMVAARRPRWNFALQRAVEYARQLDKPLLVFEPLRVAYPWASDRLHTFVLQGMSDNARAFSERGVTYLPYVEREPGEGRGLLVSLATAACAVVTDDYPAFFLPRMVSAAADALPVRLEAVDGNGLLPLRAGQGVFARAFDFRRFLQNHLPPHLRRLPEAEPLREVPSGSAQIPPTVAKRWNFASHEGLRQAHQTASTLPIDHRVAPVATNGGFVRGEQVLASFVAERLDRYGTDRNHPDAQASSGLSPYLHFGHVSAHQAANAVWKHEEWTPDRVIARGKGAKQGWWKLSESAEAFFDELVTWRELGFNMAHFREDHDAYETLPTWAQTTLQQHAGDKREAVYDLDDFACARTHDLLWNAAQTQLLAEGCMHGYLRMLWGKSILAWSESPRVALGIMTELNNRYALDGRDPNSASGIFWVLGRYDRAWGPERPVFGKVRYMTSASTRKKLRLQRYLSRFGTTPTVSFR